jgi:Divergent InlB B-repeat domain
MRASKQPRVPSALLRPALWFCACNLLATAVAAQCTNPTQVPNGTYTSGDHSQVDNNALSASNFAVSSGATATFVAGNCIHMAPGFRANAAGATVPTTFHAWADIAPTPVSVVPSSPPQNPPLSQSFTWTVSSPDGRSNLSHVFALFNTTSSTANACYIHYDASSNLVYLADNASSTWLGGFAASSSGSIGNSQCTIAGTNSSPNPTSSGTQLGLTLNVTFNAASFSGSKNEYLYALDGSGVSTGWQQMGTWMVPGPPAPDFTLTTAMDSYYVQTGVLSNASYTLAVTPQNGFNSPVSFSMSWPMYGCGYTTFNPAQVSGPPWTTTVSMQCYETLQNSYWTTVTASGGGKSHQLNLFLYVAQGQQYFLTTAVSPAGSGSIYPASGWYSSGTQVTVTAAANAGYQFTGFSGSLTGGSPGYVIMNANKSVTANFTQTVTSYSLTTSVSPSGSGTLTFSPPCCTYNAGTQVTIIPSAASGYQFNGWTGVDSGSGAIGYVTMNSNRSVTANFIQISTQYQLTTNVSPSGSGTLNFNPPCCTYNAGTQVTITASAASGYQFSSFTGVDSSTGSTGYVTMNGNRSVTGSFTPTSTTSGGVPGTDPDLTVPPSTMPSFPSVSAPGGGLRPFNVTSDITIDQAAIQSGSIPGAVLTPDGNSVVLNVSSVNVSAGATVEVSGFDYVVFNSAGQINVSGTINADGPRVAFLAAADLTVPGTLSAKGKDGQPATSGVVATVNLPCPTCLHTLSGVGGRGGNGGDGGSAAAGTVGFKGQGGAGLAGAGGGGWPTGTAGVVGQGPRNSPGQPQWQSTSGNCDSSPGAAGGSGGSNGTAGAAGGGLWAGPTGYGHYLPQPAFDSPLASLSPRPAGGGSGGSAGCGVPYGNATANGYDYFDGASGGGGGGGGGAGGTFILQATGALNILGSIDVRGGNGGPGGSGGRTIYTNNQGAGGGGGGGGGAGGFMVLNAKTVSVVGMLLAYGGSGGTGGAGGAGGNGGLTGYNGAGGGGGRIVVYTNSAFTLPGPADGSAAYQSSGGSPTNRVVSAILTNTPANFVPKHAWFENAFSNTCNQGGCYQPYTLTVTPASATGIPTFQLDSSSLRGYATNACSSFNCNLDPADAGTASDTAPDYLFEGVKQTAGFGPTSNQGQTISTTTPVNSATVTVTSVDYGGAAKLSATVNFNGIILPASVQNSTEGFARIPNDSSCKNGIADSWQMQVTGGVRCLDPNEDSEEGWPGSTYRGDGYSAHDEYRGFVVFDANAANYVQTRTDPLITKNVFYLDNAAITPSLQAMLAPQTAGPNGVCGQGANPNGVPCMLFHNTPYEMVGLLDANAAVTKDTPVPKPVNRNTVGPTIGKAIVYLDWNLGGNCAGPPPNTVVTGDAQWPFNDGFKPILIDNQNITDCAALYGFPQAVWRAQVVAHETGHRLNIPHPHREAPWVPIADFTPASLANLPPANYASTAPAQAPVTAYVWKSSYVFGPRRFATESVTGDGGVLAGVDFGAPSRVFPVPPAPEADNSVFSVNVPAALPLTGGTPEVIWLQIQEQHMMDWTPRFTLANMADWTFMPRDLLNMCLTRPCH